MRKANITGMVGLVLSGVLFVAVNQLANRAGGGMGVDLTEGSLYTLTDTTRTLLGKLSEPIVFRLYRSRSIVRSSPVVNLHGERMERLLRVFAQAGQGKISVQVIDPKPFSREQDQAQAQGLQSLPLGTGDGRGWLGIVATNTVEDVEIIPFLDPAREGLAEYDLARIVYALSLPKRPKLGIVSRIDVLSDAEPQPGQGQQQEKWTAFRQLAEFFTLVLVSSEETSLPGDLDMLVVVHPRDMNDQLGYHIDQYVIGGGRAIFVVDPESEIERFTQPNPGANQTRPTYHSDPEPWFSAWGIRFDPKNLIGDLSRARRVTMNDPGSGKAGIDYVLWQSLSNDQFSPTNPALSQLRLVNLASPGTLGLIDPEGELAMEPLLWSSRQSMIISTDGIAGLPDPKRLLEEFVPSGESFPFAAWFRGKAKSAYTDSTLAGEQSESDKPAPRPHRGDGKINIVVLADSDMLSDEYWVQHLSFLGSQLSRPFADNGELLVGLAKWLSGATELLGLKVRGIARRPFTVVEDIRRGTEERFRARETKLVQRMAELVKEIDRLSKVDPSDSAVARASPIPGPTDREGLARLRRELLQARKELRAIQRESLIEIERLKARASLGNLGLFPMIVVLAGVAVLLTQRRRMRRATPVEAREV